MRSRILIGLIAGTLGGFLGWLLQENLINYNAHILQGVLPGQGAVSQAISAEEGRTLAFSVGGLIGLFLGLVDGIVEGNARKLLQGMIVGALSGMLLGSVGLVLGNAVFSALGGSSVQESPGLFSFGKQIIARSFGWAFMGLGLGIGSAIASRSKKRIWHGAIGGLLGGFLGGLVFDLVAMSSLSVHGALASSGPRDIGGPSRMIGFTAIGGLTGFFIGLVEEMLKQAWVKVLAGRNEGKDFILTKQISLLGRDERCDVPLYGDPAIAPQHAAIRSEGNRHILMDGNAQMRVVVNGQTVPNGGELMLKDGDMIQIGSQRILFREKATANKYARQPIDVPKANSPVASTPIPAHLCPYCGGQKDAAGNCLCSVPGNAPAPVGAASGSVSAPPQAVVGSSNVSAPAAYGTPVMATNGYAQQPYNGNGYATPPTPGATHLIGVEGPYAGQVFLLTQPNMTVGREPQQDISLVADSTISRNHARLAVEGERVVVYDNGSSNGTYVNGVRVSMQMLAPGDIVQFGGSKFRYE